MRRRMEKENTEGRLVAHRKTRKEGEKKEKEIHLCKYVPESPTGAEYVVPPVPLDEGPESGESNGERKRH